MYNYLYVSILQNLLFCVPKAALLHGKSVGFASQNSHFRNAKAQLPLFKGFIFTKSMVKKKAEFLVWNSARILFDVRSFSEQ
ncbi:hypothetical protein [Prevotella intermedia]|uniref:Uncharacterized protein n=1 Tax=Prevotella intermedia TaxID=28131 RepID=A0A2D3N8T1_PREIN|nr:hypothetical protein CTM50_00845 [Prevotella intermedia]